MADARSNPAEGLTSPEKGPEIPAAKQLGMLAVKAARNPEQAIPSVENAFRQNAYLDEMQEYAEKQKLNVEVYDIPVNEWAGILRDDLDMHEFPNSMRTEIRDMLVPLTQKLDSGNPYFQTKTEINAQYAVKNLRLLEGLLGDKNVETVNILTPVRRAYIKSVCGLLTTVIDRHIEVEDGLLMLAKKDTQTMYGLAARGREDAKKTPHSVAGRRAGKVGGFMIASTVALFGVGSTLFTLQQYLRGQRSDASIHPAVLAGGVIMYLFHKGKNLFPDAIEAVRQQASVMGTEKVRKVLVDNHIEGTKGAETMDILLAGNQDEARKAFLGSTPGDTVARTAYLDRIGANEQLLELTDAELRILVKAAGSLEDKESRMLVRNFIEEYGPSSAIS